MSLKMHSIRVVLSISITHLPCWFFVKKRKWKHPGLILENGLSFPDSLFFLILALERTWSDIKNVVLSHFRYCDLIYETSKIWVLTVTCLQSNFQAVLAITQNSWSFFPELLPLKSHAGSHSMIDVVCVVRVSPAQSVELN